MAASGGRVPTIADGFFIVFELSCFTDVGGTYQEQEDPRKTPYEGVFHVRYVVVRHRKLPHEVCRFQSG